MPSLADITRALPDYKPGDLPVDTARHIVASCIKPLEGSELLPLQACLGRILAADLLSPINVPAHDNAAMDGYAVRGTELAEGLDFTIAGTAMAGTPWPGRLQTQQCVRIMTGAVMPTGCDTVIMQEVVVVEGNRVRVPAHQKTGQNRRLAGEDLQAGKPALHAGKKIGPAELGLVASLGIAQLEVRRRLRVAIFSSGDELRSLGETLDEGCIYDSNRYTLTGLLQGLGVEVIDLGVVRDSPEDLEAAMRTACTQADAIITSGGVSVGEADFTRALMARLGEVAFWTIAMKPGRPFAFGRIRSGASSAVLFGLPGNPVAVMVTFLVFVREALLHMAGASDTRPPLISAICDSPIKKSPGRTEYQRGILSATADGLHVRVTGAQGSGILRSMSEANCLIVLAPDQGSVSAGQAVPAWLFEGLL